MHVSKDPIKKAEWIINISVAMTGKKCVRKYKKYPKMSAAHKDKHYPKLSAALKGKKYKPMSELGKANIRTAHLGLQCGEKNPNFNDWNSFKPYDQEFNESFKADIRARDKVCQLCGKTPEQELEEFSQVLSVHHCHYGKITKDDVFITLCKRCNSKVNKRSERACWTKFFTAWLALQKGVGMVKQIQEISILELQQLLADGRKLIERSKAVYIPTSAVEDVVSKIQKELDRRDCQ